MGAGLSVICGLALWIMPLGEKWENASYDYLYIFGTRSVSNNVVLVLMDNPAYEALGQSRETHWNRELHAKLVKKLADDDCPLVVFDIFFTHPDPDPAKDAALSGALHRLKKVVLGTRTAEENLTGASLGELLMPIPMFLAAPNTNWGLGLVDNDSSGFVRRDWPSPDPDRYPSLSWTAARLAGAHLRDVPQDRWLRYYGKEGAWATLSYQFALSNKPPGYYRDKVVFIGNDPSIPDPAIREVDKYSTPYVRWTDKSAAVGGVQIHATSFLNLLNGDWLRRMPSFVEAVVIVGAGIVLGGGLCRFRRGAAVGLTVLAALMVMAVGIGLSQFTNFWFPWLIVAGGQLPCALAFVLLLPAKAPAPPAAAPQPEPARPPAGTIVLQFAEERLPDAPEYEIFSPPIGQGGFGKVWIVRNAIGQWQALKAVYQAKFGSNTKPYEAEFNGLQRYKPVSEKHPGLLRIDLVSKMKNEGYFYYIMELGDAQAPGWEHSPATYKPRDLEHLRKQAENRRLPAMECLRMVTVLAEALDFLHTQGLTHRDIKPSNVIFVQGRPKLADVGLVADIRPPDEINTLVGTLGYMPPPPEPPGTPQADIFALGMLLYVISTGRDPGFFPDLATTLMERSGYPEFVRLNAIVLKACQPDVARRYQAASEMLRDLQVASKSVDPV
jgi:CHASE2 domain-containing sensor protein